MSSLLSSSLPLLAVLGIVFPALIWAGLQRPALGLGVLLLALPVLNLARRLFSSADSIPYPSLETIAVVLLWISVQIRQLGRRGHDAASCPLPSAHWGTGTKIAVAVFLLASLGSSLLSHDPSLSLKILLCGGVIPLLAYCVALKLRPCWSDVKPLIWGIFGMTLQIGLYTVLTFRQRQMMTGADELLAWMYGAAPAAGLFVVPSVAVTMVVPAIPLAAWYWQHGHVLRQLRHSGYREEPRAMNLSDTLVTLAVLVAALTTAALGLSRGCWAGVAVATVCSLPLLFRRMRLGPLILVVGAAALLFFSGAFETVAQIISFRLGGGNASRNVDIRNVNFALALLSAPKHILTGVGLGQYTEVYAEFPNAMASMLPRLWFAHSLFLTLIPEIGLIGTVAFAVIFVRGLVQAARFGRRLGTVRNAECEMRNAKCEAWLPFSQALLIGVIAYIVIASTTGAHLVSYVLCNPQYLFYDPNGTYFTSSALILTFALLGTIAAISRRPAEIPGSESQ